MKISIGFSPCPNDTFMFAAMVNHWIDTKGFTFDVHMEDIETLNEWADHEKLQVTKLSFHKALHLESTYSLLQSGAALGTACGPLLISQTTIDENVINEGPVILPGKWTTANLLFSRYYPNAVNKVYRRFDTIESSLLGHDAVAGVIIHENRFTYESKGLVKINDLGESWELETGLPIPLGGIFASRKLDEQVHAQLGDIIRSSIQYAYSHTGQTMSYVRQFSQEMDEAVMKQHIDLYVNAFSIELGETGQQAVALLRKSLWSARS